MTDRTPETAASSHQPMGMWSVSLAMMTVVLWGGTAVANQFAMDAWPPLFVGGARFGLAALFMVGWCLVEGSPLLLKRGQWRIAMVLGGLLFLQIGLFNFGVWLSNSSHASILVNSYIFWVAAWEHWIVRTIRLQWWQVLGLLLAGLGCGCVFVAMESGKPSGLDQPSLTGDLILMLSGLTLAGKILYTKRSVQSIDPGPLIMWHDVFGTICFFTASLLVGEERTGPTNFESWTALLFSGLIISGFCFGANALLLRRHGASQVSVFSFATPLFGVALGVWLRGDALSMWLAVAGVFVCLGIFLTNVTGGSRGV